MTVPTAVDVIEESQVDFGPLGFDDAADLQVLVDQAVALIYAYTFRQWGPDFDGPAPLEPLARQAVRALTEMLAFRAQEDIPETLSDFDLIQSFSAGSYSESRRDPRQSMQIGIAQLIAYQMMLWPLMTEDAQDQWIQLTGGTPPPAFAVTEVDWSGGRGESPNPFDAGTLDREGPGYGSGPHPGDYPQTWRSGPLE